MNLLDFSAIQGKPIEKWFSSAESDYEEWHGLEKRSLWMTPMPAMRTSFMVRKRRNWNLTNA